MKKTLWLTCLLMAPPAWADPKNPRPDWVDSASLEYPRESYLTGVGIADDRPTAQDRARGEISKIFLTQVSVDTALTESENNSSQGRSFTQSVSQSVQTTSRKALEGVELVAHWQDAKTQQHYALAALDRRKAAAVLRDKIADFDRQATRWNGELDKSSEKLQKVRAALKLLALLKARADLNGDLRVVESEGKGLASPIDEPAARPKAAKALAALEIAVDLSGAKSEEVETGLISGLSSLGLQARSPGSGRADIIIEGKLETRPASSNDARWRWARSSVTLTLKEGASGKTFLRFDQSDRQASADYEEAARRTHKALGRKVAQRVGEAVTQYFENQ
ncbi:MAG: LPP20 family lipoprotein [Elusimicrobia bacterium]|nr:LPP20 family lipoprotein [Elusimicrobiota bacterium]